MIKRIAIGSICLLFILSVSNLFGTGIVQAKPVPNNSLSENINIKILGIDPTAYPKIKVNIFVDKFCAMAGDLDKEDFRVEEDGNEVAIDNFYFTGKAMGQKLDLAVVFDETDTMADEIDAMQSKVDDLTNKIKAINIDARYSLVTFKTEVLPKIEWTGDAEVFKREVDLLRASSGNYQRPEDSLGSVAKALSFGFRPDAQKIIIVITDEPSMQKGDGWSNSTYYKDEVQQDLLNAGVMLVAVSPDFRSGTIPSNIPRSDLPLYADMRELAQNSGGLWIDIYSADFSIILDQLEEIITGTYVIEYTSPATTTTDSRIVSVSVDAPDCAEGGASSSYTPPASPTVPNEPPIIIDLTSDKTSPKEVGSSITWTAEAEDPDGDQVLYKFFLDYEPMTEWTAENTWTWMAPREVGLYRVEAEVRDGTHAGTNGMDDRKAISFEITGPNNPPYITSLTSDKMSPQKLGSRITWTTKAADPDGDPILYRFLLDDEPMTDWKRSIHWTWTAPKEAGSYRIEAQVRDGLHAGPNGMDDHRLEPFEITETELVESDIVIQEVDPLINILGTRWSTKSSVAFSPDGRTLASGSWDGTIKLWDVSTGSELRTLESHSDAVESVAFSPDGRTLASGSSDDTIKLWDVSSGLELRTLEGHSDAVESVAFSPDGRTLASSSGSEGDGTIKLWNVSSGSELRTLKGHSSWVSSIAFSPDGQTLASGSSDDTIKLWDVSSGSELRMLEAHSISVHSVAFSPDGRTLASGSWDGTIKLWDVFSGSELRTLEGQSISVSSVAFSPDGRTLASGNSYYTDDTVTLWDVSSGSELQTLEGHSDAVLSVAFSPNGRTLASGSVDGTIRLWSVS